MYQTYKDRAQFFLIYIREAHPSDQKQSGRQFGNGGGPDIKQPTTEEERRDVAGECVQNLKLTMLTLIDGMNNKVNHAYAAGPDRLYVIDSQGKIAYNGAQGPQGFKPDEAEAALKKILARK